MNIYVGSRFAAEDGDFLFSNQIKRIVNLVAHKIPNRFALMGIKYLSFQFENSSQIFDHRDENIQQLVRFIQDSQENDVQLLIHSELGDNRSVVFVAGYLVHRFHWPPNRALKFVEIKRTRTNPSPELVSQLKEFAQRRQDKYGPFKDIFDINFDFKMNQTEVLHRNTFLNATATQHDYTPECLQQSPVTVLAKLELIQQKQVSLRWRDGLQSTQPPARFAQFNQNNEPLNPHLTSALFRGKTISYKDNVVTRNIQVKVDIEMAPSLGIDLDIKGLHARRQDGHLYPLQKDLRGQPVCTLPVSIIKSFKGDMRTHYDESSQYVSTEDFEQRIITALSHQQQLEQQQEAMKPESVIEQLAAQTIGPPSPNIAKQMQQKSRQQQMLIKQTFNPVQRVTRPVGLAATPIPVKKTGPIIPDLVVQARPRGRSDTPPKRPDLAQLTQTLQQVSVLPEMDRTRPSSQNPKRTQSGTMGKGQKKYGEM